MRWFALWMTPLAVSITSAFPRRTRTIARRAWHTFSGS